jgi:hypothetical protein
VYPNNVGSKKGWHGMKKNKLRLRKKYERQMYNIYHDFMHYISAVYDGVDKAVLHEESKHSYDSYTVDTLKTTRNKIWDMCKVCQRGLMEEMKRERKNDI